MNDRLKARPKSVTSGLQRASVSTKNLHLSVVRAGNAWKPDAASSMWVAEASSNLLGKGLDYICLPLNKYLYIYINVHL